MSKNIISSTEQVLHILNENLHYYFQLKRKWYFPPDITNSAIYIHSLLPILRLVYIQQGTFLNIVLYNFIPNLLNSLSFISQLSPPPSLALKSECHNQNTLSPSDTKTIIIFPTTSYWKLFPR